MAKFKIGEGIKFEVKAPITKAIKELPLMQTIECVKCEILDKEISILQEKIGNNEENILDVMNSINELDMSSMVETKIIHPEIKAITINKDYSVDLKNIQDGIIFVEDQTRTKIKNEGAKRTLLAEKLNNNLKKQKTINIMLGLGLAVTLLLHLI